MIKINVYKSGGEWFGARWIDADYDGCYELAVESSASVAEALAHAMLMPLPGRDDSERREVNLTTD